MAGPNILYCRCSGQQQGISAEPGMPQHWQGFLQQPQPARGADGGKLRSLHMQAEAPHPLASAPMEADTAQAVHPYPAAHSACQQQSQAASLPLCPPLTQLSQGGTCSSANAQLRPPVTLSGANQVLRLPAVEHDLAVTTRPWGSTVCSSNAVECAGADAAEPVSQVLPDTAMELCDFGGDELPEPNHAAAGAGDDTKAAEALQELEDFCRCELLGLSRSQVSTATNGGFCLPLCSPTFRPCLFRLASLLSCAQTRLCFLLVRKGWKHATMTTSRGCARTCLS